MDKALNRSNFRKYKELYYRSLQYIPSLLINPIFVSSNAICLLSIARLVAFEYMVSREIYKKMENHVKRIFLDDTRVFPEFYDIFNGIDPESDHTALDGLTIDEIFVRFFNVMQNSDGTFATSFQEEHPSMCAARILSVSTLGIYTFENPSFWDNHRDTLRINLSKDLDSLMTDALSNFKVIVDYHDKNK